MFASQLHTVQMTGFRFEVSFERLCSLSSQLQAKFKSKKGDSRKYFKNVIALHIAIILQGHLQIVSCSLQCAENPWCLLLSKLRVRIRGFFPIVILIDIRSGTCALLAC